MSVYKRGKYFYMNFTVNGIRIFKSTKCTTKREAKAVAALERQRVLKQSKLSPQEKSAQITLSEAIEQTYEAKWKYNKDSRRTLRRAQNLMQITGDIKLSEITASTVTKLTKVLEVKGSTPATVNRYLAALKTILKHHHQPSSYVSLRKERKKRTRILTKEEERTMLDTFYKIFIRRGGYYAEMTELVSVLLDTGMRLSEGLGLSYSDIDFSSNLITIWINKGDRPRSIPMTSRVRSILLKRQEHNPLQPFTMKAHQAETAWKQLRKDLDWQGPDHPVIHTLRHTCASRMVNAGVDLYVVKEVLGHASIQVTERYAHLAPHKLADAVAALED